MDQRSESEDDSVGRKDVATWKDRAAKAQVISVLLVFVYTLFAGWQLVTMRQQGGSVNKQLEALKQQGEVMKQQLKAMQIQTEAMQGQLDWQVGELAVVRVEPYKMGDDQADGIKRPKLKIQAAKLVRMKECRFRMWPVERTSADFPTAKDLAAIVEPAMDVLRKQEAQHCRGPVTEDGIPLDSGVENISPEQKKLVKAGKQVLFYIGDIVYVDVLKRERTMDFCKYLQLAVSDKWQDCSPAPQLVVKDSISVF